MGFANSDTPRTDKNVGDIAADGLVDGEFARGLERELAHVRRMMTDLVHELGLTRDENERLKRLHGDAFHEAERWKEREAEARRALSETQKLLDESVAREAAFLTHHCESEGCAVEGEYTTKAARWADQYHAMKAELAKVLQQQAEADNERDAVEEGLRAYAGELAGLLSCAVLYVGCVSDPQNPAVQRLREDIRAALAKAPTDQRGSIETRAGEHSPDSQASADTADGATPSSRSHLEFETNSDLAGALSDLLRQVEAFTEENGEADFFTGRARAALRHQSGKNTVMGTCTSTVAMGTVCSTGVAQTEREAIVEDMKRLRQRAIDLGMPLSSVEEINAELRPQVGKLDYEAMSDAFDAWEQERPAGSGPIRPFDAFMAGARFCHVAGKKCERCGGSGVVPTADPEFPVQQCDACHSENSKP